LENIFFLSNRYDASKYVEQVFGEKLGAKKSAPKESPPAKDGGEEGGGGGTGEGAEEGKEGEGKEEEDAKPVLVVENIVAGNVDCTKA